MNCPECCSSDTYEQELRPPMPGTTAHQCVECEAAWLSSDGVSAEAVASGEDRRRFRAQMDQVTGDLFGGGDT